MKTFSNAPIKDRKGEDIKIPMGDGKVPSTEFCHALRFILNNASFQSQNDSIQGARLADAIDNAEGKEVVEMEEGVYDWLVIVAETVTPTLFRISGNIVYKFICEGFEKAPEPAKKPPE